MSVEAIESRIVIPTVGELGQYFPEHTASFLGSLLVRKEIQPCIDAGYDWGLEAARYLDGSETGSKRFEFYVGHISNPKTRAVHTLKHFAFKDYMFSQPNICYDELNDRFVSRVPDSGNTGRYSDSSHGALYRVENHYDLLGEPGVVSYLSPDYKQSHDAAVLYSDQPAVIAAKRLIAGA